MNSKHLSLSSLPPFPRVTKDKNRGYQIALYLDRLLSVFLVTDENPIALPSLADLASFFQVSQLEVYDAFQILRKQGYDYTLSGLNEKIPFWSLYPKQEEMAQHQ